MPFDPEVKMRMFLRCERHCCLCKKQCGTKIEAAHIIDESDGGANDEENGIPLCFDCHQEVGSYNDKHPRGNKFRPDELRARRDRVYVLVAAGKLDTLQPANLQRLIERRMELRTANESISNPTVADLIGRINKLEEDPRSFLIRGRKLGLERGGRVLERKRKSHMVVSPFVF
jgi:hypothetical protein